MSAAVTPWFSGDVKPALSGICESKTVVDAGALVPARPQQNIPATLDRIESELSVASSPQEVNHLLALMDAAVAYAKHHYKDQQDVIQRARTLRLQAERRLGEMLRAMPKATGAKGVGPIAVPHENRNQTPTLADIGITKKTSMRAQQLAAMPADRFAMVASGELSVSQATATPRKAAKPMTGPKADSIREELASAKSRGTSMLSSYARLILGVLAAQSNFTPDELELLNQVASAIHQLNPQEHSA
jgi:hypothetical protein